MNAHILALEVDLHLPAARSLKDRRAVVQRVLAAARNLGAGAADTSEDGKTKWQRAELAFTSIANQPRKAEQVIASIERYLHAVPEAEVLRTERRWLKRD